MSKVFCAIDSADFDVAQELASQVAAAGCSIKLGLEFFNAFGPQGIKKIIETSSASVFLDLKYHDIPNTVAGAVRAVSDLGVTYLNIHAGGGLEMMRAAKEACAPDTKLLAVTVLTSLDDTGLEQVGQQIPAKEQVLRLARLTQEAGLDGVVCSAHEIEAIREACGPDFILMVPGIRPAGSATGDQKRVMTPAQAMAKGATHLVIGRPITKADNPGKAATDILQSLSG